MTVAPHSSSNSSSNQTPERYEQLRRLVLSVLAAACATAASATILTAATVLVAAISLLHSYGGCDWRRLTVVLLFYIEAGTVSLIAWCFIRSVTGNKTLALTLALSLAFLLPTCGIVASTEAAYKSFCYSVSDHSWEYAIIGFLWPCAPTIICGFMNIRLYESLLRKC